MSSPYHEGIAARKALQGKHENPYRGYVVGFVDWIFDTGIRKRISIYR